jgi:hypothetical protein
VAEFVPVKIKANSTPKLTAARPQKKGKAAAAAPAEKTWKPAPATRTTAARKAVSAMATDAAVKVIASHEGPPKTVTGKHPMLEKFGEKLGMGLGVIVTEALALVPSWNTPVLDKQGKPAASVPGAQRIGNHDLLKRHQEAVGPQVTALVEKMPAGALHDLLEGLGKGATAAPGASYRLEAAVSDRLHKR